MHIITFYENKESHNPVCLPIWELPEIILEKKVKEATEKFKTGLIQKDELPIIVPTAMMKPGNKIMNNCLTHSRLIWLDIDKKDNESIDLETIIDKINNDPYTFLTWRSPRNGFRIVVKTPGCNVANHQFYWKAVADYYLNEYGIIADDRPRNVNSICFLNHDGDLFYNFNPAPFVIDMATTLTANQMEYVSNTSIDRVYDTSNTCANITLVHSYYTNATGCTDFRRLNYRTLVDELSFIDMQEPLYIPGGMDYCEIYVTNGWKFREGMRHKPLGRMSMILLFNNPGVSYHRLLKEMKRLNEKYCRPPLPEKELADLVKDNFTKYRENRMDFSGVVKKRYLFYSESFTGCTLTDTQRMELAELNDDMKNSKIKEYNRENRMKLSMQALWRGRKDEIQRRYENAIHKAIETYQNLPGVKITYAFLAKLLNVSEILIQKRITKELKKYLKATNATNRELYDKLYNKRKKEIKSVQGRNTNPMRNNI